MRFNEITRSRNEMPKELPRKDLLTQDYLERVTKTRHKINEYPVFELRPGGRSRTEIMLFIGNVSGTELLGNMALLKYPHSGQDYVFSEVYFDPELQGKGFAVPLYKLAILEYGYTIVSDETQTKGSEKLWNNLSRDSDIVVYVWDTNTDQYRDFDPDDPDDVYFDPEDLEDLKAESDRIRSKLQDQYLDGDIDDAEYGSLLKQYLNPIYDEIESAENKKDIRLVATGK